jgi:hypothetical protein
MTKPDKDETTKADPLEERLMAFAEQLGRMVGTIQAKADGWMDRETLNKQITSVRDDATRLLEQLAGGAKKATKRAKEAAAAARQQGSKGRKRSSGTGR